MTPTVCHGLDQHRGFVLENQGSRLLHGHVAGHDVVAVHAQAPHAVPQASPVDAIALVLFRRGRGDRETCRVAAKRAHGEPNRKPTPVSTNKATGICFVSQSMSLTVFFWHGGFAYRRLH